MLKPKFSGTITQGKLVLHNRSALERYLSSFQDGAVVDVMVSPRRRQRSLKQNAYYWGVVLKLISESTGETPQKLHDTFKMMFLPPTFTKFNGKTTRAIPHTPDTNTLEFSEYIEHIRAEAATMGIVIPDPDQIHF